MDDLLSGLLLLLLVSFHFIGDAGKTLDDGDSSDQLSSPLFSHGRQWVVIVDWSLWLRGGRGGGGGGGWEKYKCELWVGYTRKW